MKSKLYKAVPGEEIPDGPHTVVGVPCGIAVTVHIVGDDVSIKLRAKEKTDITDRLPYLARMLRGLNKTFQNTRAPGLTPGQTDAYKSGLGIIGCIEPRRLNSGRQTTLLDLNRTAGPDDAALCCFMCLPLDVFGKKADTTDLGLRYKHMVDSVLAHGTDNYTDGVSPVLRVAQRIPANPWIENGPPISTWDRCSYAVRRQGHHGVLVMPTYSVYTPGTGLGYAIDQFDINKHIDLSEEL